MKRFLFTLLAFFFLGITPIKFGDFSVLNTQTVFAACTAEKIADGIPCSDTGFEAPDQSKVNSKINEKDFRTQVLKLTNYFLTFLGLLAVISIVYGGVQLVGSFGDEDAQSKAKTIIMSAAMGIVIILVSYSFVNWVIKSGDGVDGTTNPGTVIVDDNNVIDENTRFLDEIQGILESIGKLDKNTSDLLTLIQQMQSREGDYSQQFADIAEALSQKSIEDKSYFDTIKEALLAQGYEASVGETIVQKIENGEKLTEDDYSKIKTSLQYGLMLQRFETEINILYKSMPQTAVNVAAYNDVITILTESKADPTNETIIQKLKDSFSDFKTLIDNTPSMTASINVSPSGGSAPLIVSFDGSNSTDPNDQTIPKDNYTWTYLDSNGVEQTIGKGPIVEYEFEDPGLYVVYLRVETAMKENGYKTAMDGVAKVKIKVQPEDSQLKIYVDNKLVHSIRKVHIDDAKKGISFDASESEPRVGRKIVEYKWTFGDGATDYSENGEAITHSYEKVGQYLVRLETQDNTGETIFKEFKLVIEHLTADIDISPEEGDTRTTFEMNALNSKSSDFVIRDYGWKIFNPSGKVEKQGDKEKLTFEPETPGKYKIQLIVTDAQGNTSTETYALDVKSLEPTASFIAQRVSTSSPASFIFNASSSSDAENDVLLYSWDFNSDGKFEKENMQESTIAYTYPVVGSYKALLKVTDPYGEHDELTQVVNVESILAVDFDMSVTAVHVGNEVVLTPKSPLAQSFYWDFGDGNQISAGTESYKHSFDTSGNFNITLTAFDSEDNENKVTKRIFVGDGTTPVAAYQLEVDGKQVFPEVGVCGQKGLGLKVTRRNNIKFMGDESINIDGSHHMLNYTWAFGDGEFGSTKVTSHRYTELTDDKNCFKVVLTVNDRVSGGSNATESLFIQVENMKPVFQKLIVNTNTTDTKSLVTPLDIRLQAQGAYDPDGQIHSYRWWYRNVNSPENTKKSVTQTQEPFANITLESDGLAGIENEYVFSVEMIDNEGLSASSDESSDSSPTLKVKNGNVNAPLADFTMDKSQVFIGDTVSFFAQTKNVPEGEDKAVSYEWDFDGDGVFDDTTSGQQVARRFESPGEFEVRLRVKYKGLTSSQKHTVFVDKITNYPLAAFSISTQDLTVSVDASSSRSDPSIQNDVLSYSWDFDRFEDANGDGDAQNDNEANSANAKHAYTTPGAYFITLTVKDKRGSVDSVERKVDLSPGTSSGSISDPVKTIREKHSLVIQSTSNPLTTLDLTLQKNIISAGETTMLKVRVLNADGSLYNGNIEYELMEGNASLSSDQQKAVNGRGEVSVTAHEMGIVRIKVRAKNTFHQTLEEIIYLEVQ